ncbi:MAG TPA: hypothetical protein VM925_27605 [Labilithrix sp.]|nr:hypothetical protein [Labilithrix sp.]
MSQPPHHLAGISVTGTLEKKLCCWAKSSCCAHSSERDEQVRASPCSGRERSVGVEPVLTGEGLEGDQVGEDRGIRPALTDAREFIDLVDWGTHSCRFCDARLPTATAQRAPSWALHVGRPAPLSASFGGWQRPDGPL